MSCLLAGSYVFVSSYSIPKRTNLRAAWWTMAVSCRQQSCGGFLKKIYTTHTRACECNCWGWINVREKAQFFVREFINGVCVSWCSVFTVCASACSLSYTCRYFLKPSLSCWPLLCWSFAVPTSDRLVNMNSVNTIRRILRSSRLFICI